MLFNRLSNYLKRTFRFVAIAIVGGLLFISSVNPAQAASGKVTEGEASLNRVQKETDDVARSNPRGIEEVTEKAQKGLNAVQGAADRNKMVSPEEAKGATTVEEQAANFLENIKN